MGIKKVLFDDLDERIIEDGQGGTVRFSFRGENYAVELRHENEEKLAEALAPFIAVARKEPAAATAPPSPAAPTTAPKAPGSRRRKRTPRNHDLREVRRWLAENGHEVAERGPVKRHLIALYEEANPEA